MHGITIRMFVLSWRSGMTQSDTNLYDTPEYAGYRRDEWLADVESLICQITDWSKAENWLTERRSKSITERYLGRYDAPELFVRLPTGELLVTPIGLNPLRGSGRVDIEAIPTLNRVRLISLDDGWRIVTDSNVPLRVPWNCETFKQLADDLLA